MPLTLETTPSPALSSADLISHYEAATGQSGTWIDLTTLQWSGASSGWQVAADFGTPHKGTAFTDGPLVVGGREFPSGIGTYPLSEITYPLGGEYTAFRAFAGIDDSASVRGSVVVIVYADDVLLFRSPVLRAGDDPLLIELPLFAGDELRLVVDDAGDGSHDDFADWLALDVFRARANVADRAIWGQLVQDARDTATLRGTSLARPALPLLPLTPVEIAGVGYDEANCLVVVEAGETWATFGYGGAHHGQLAIFSAGADSPILANAVSRLRLADGRWLSLDDMQPTLNAPWDVAGISDPALGEGTRVVAHLKAPRAGSVAVEIEAYESTGQITYRLRRDGGPRAVAYEYFRGDTSAVLGADPRFFADRTRFWRGRVPADGLDRSVPLGPGSPLLLWSGDTGKGLLMATIDESNGPLEVTLERQPDTAAVAVGLEMRLLPTEAAGVVSVASPRLWIQAADAGRGLEAFSSYRELMARMYPPAPWPEWLRYQWNSWWSYGPTVTADRVTRHVDFITQNLSDLGPWNVLIDAAWYVAYGRPTADFRNIDYEKFPDGIRPVVDYAHQHDISVGLFLSAGFVHSGSGDGGEWLALRALIDEHRDWLVPIVSGSAIDTYMLDYGNPEVRRYMRAVVDDFALKYGVDGIKLDGLADPEGQLTSMRDRQDVQSVSPYLPATEILRMLSSRFFAHRPDGYVESGWINPVFAHPYAHAFWQGDNWPEFDREYPFGGLIQHVDYALFQRKALGQRAKLGTVWGEPNSQDVRRWFEAGLALGAQVTAGFDLTALNQEGLTSLRCLLAHYNAFDAEVQTSSRMRPNVFATTSRHITYLGVLNRTRQPRSFDDEIGELGVLAPGLKAFDVERKVWVPATAVTSFQIPSRSFRLFIIPNQPRVVWTNASVSYQPSGDDRLVATLRGPADLPGFAEVWAPDATSVLVNGQPLRRALRAGVGAYGFDPTSGVVHLRVSYQEPVQIEVLWPA